MPSTLCTFAYLLTTTPVAYPHTVLRDAFYVAMTRLQGSKRALARGNAPISIGKRRKTAGKGTKSQPVLINNT
jgi:hypothetical protein